MADYKGRIGNLIRDARKHRGLTQHQLAELLGTSQSAINRIEKGHQNLSLEMLARIGAALDSEIVALGALSDRHTNLDFDQSMRSESAASALSTSPTRSVREERPPGYRNCRSGSGLEAPVRARREHV